MSIDVDALKARADLANIVGSYVALKKQGREFKGLCCFHNDHSPSLYVIPAKGLVHCFGCGWSGDVIEFLQEKEGITFQQACAKLGNGNHWIPKAPTQSSPPLPDRITSAPPAGTAPPDMKIRQLGEPSRTWEYKDGAGSTLGFVARYIDPETKHLPPDKQGKEIRVWTWGARGNAKPGWGCGHWAKPRPMYGLDRLAARPEAPVLVVEGEKACDAATELLPAYVCITWPGGANAWKHADLEPLRDRKVLLWPDADAPGVECMEKLAFVLTGPLDCSVRLIDSLAGPEPVAEGWDIADAQAAGWTTEQVVAWAKARAHDYSAPPRNPAPQVAEPEYSPSDAAGNGQAEATSSGVSLPPAEAGPTQDVPESPTGDAAPPPPSDTDFPAGASPVRPPPRSRKPRLASVDGNLARNPDPDDEVLPMALSESGVANEFVAMHKGRFLVCHEWASKHGPLWLAWTGSRWKREANRVQAWQAASLLGHTLKHRQEANGMTWAAKHKFETRKFTAAFLDMAGYHKDLIATPDLFDADPLMIGTPAGPVDLRMGKLLEPDPSHYITRQTSVAPVKGPHPLFDNVVAQATGGDESMRAYVWRWLGLFCSGVSVKAFLFLWGKRDSGKTTLIETVAGILGKSQDGGYATTVDMELFTESRNDKGSDRLAHLHGARLVYASETEEGRHWKASLLKLVTGKDTLEGRFLYSEKFSFKPTHKLVIFGNERPHLKQKDEGVANRMHLVEYPGVIQPEDMDDKIDEKLVAEYPAIFYDMIQGFLDFEMCGGLGKPESISRAVENYMESEDDLGGWCDECIERANSRTAAGIAYRNYKSWADRNGAFAISAKRFSSEMEKRGFMRLRSGGVRYLSGFSLKLSEAGQDRGYEIP